MKEMCGDCVLGGWWLVPTVVVVLGTSVKVYFDSSIE